MKSRVEYLLKKLKLKLEFLFRNRLYFAFHARTKPLTSTLPLTENDDVVYINLSASCLHRLDAVYDALTFKIGYKHLIHHLHFEVSAHLSMHRLLDWCDFESILEVLPTYYYFYISHIINACAPGPLLLFMFTGLLGL